MSIATSMPCIKIKVSPTHHHHHSNFCFRPATIVSSKAEGPLRRPGGPSVSPPSPPPPPLSPPLRPIVAPLKPSESPAKPVEEAVVQPMRGAVTLEYQRYAAKEMREYFRLKKLEEANQGPFFGFIGKNEISNGRWAMFGFAVGLLTEYATGSDFVEQLKILLSNFGILDLE